MDKPLEGKSPGKARGTLIDFAKLQVPTPSDDMFYATCLPCSSTGVFEDEEMQESFLNHPPASGHA
eukprot:14911206-Ditylum_brightwellii.AAC.1